MVHHSQWLGSREGEDNQGDGVLRITVEKTMISTAQIDLRDSQSNIILNRAALT